MSVKLVLLDIEGTTSSVDFVKKTLFPYSRERLPEFVQEHGDERLVRDQVRQVSDDPKAAVATLLAWLDEDRKAKPLKELQGMIWRAGYESGALRSHMYEDTEPTLRRWRSAGLDLGVYSSGSVAAQKLMFKYSERGDLTDLFTHHFDTSVGKKTERFSYRHILDEVGMRAPEVAFLSDSEAELDAASAQGIATTQIVRAQDGTKPSRRHRTARDLTEVRLDDL